jgi:hypothetical protein
LALTEGNVSDLVARLQLKEGGDWHTGSDGEHVKLAPMSCAANSAHSPNKKVTETFSFLKNSGK